MGSALHGALDHATSGGSAEGMVKAVASRAGISKCGDVMIRSVLYQAALALTAPVRAVLFDFTLEARYG